jgi:hypothetical protein
MASKGHSGDAFCSGRPVTSRVTANCLPLGFSQALQAIPVKRKNCAVHSKAEACTANSIVMHAAGQACSRLTLQVWQTFDTTAVQRRLELSVDWLAHLNTKACLDHYQVAGFSSSLLSPAQERGLHATHHTVVHIARH